MRTTVKMVSMVALGIGLLAASVAPAAAFNIIRPVSDNATGAVSAFANGDQGVAGQGGLLLSPNEVKHIKWCARHYPSYDPTDDTHAGRDGMSVACISPR